MIAALHDVAFRTVPNWIPAGLAVCGLASRIVSGDWAGGLLAATVVLALGTLLWLRGYMGGGDVKLAAASSLIVPASTVIVFVILFSLVGGVLGLGYLAGAQLVRRPPAGRPRTLPGRIAKAERWRLSRRGPLPYATAIATAGLLLLIHPTLG